MTGNDVHPSKSPPRWLRTIALASALAMIPLVVVGAGVTTKDAGMAFRDWPTSNGSIINPPGWTSNEKTLFEHGHRLLGWVVGLLVLAMAGLSWKAGGGLRVLALATLLAVCIQGVLGGIRVLADSVSLAMIHGIWAQVCLSFAFLVVLFCSQHWHDVGVRMVRAADFYQKLCIAGVIAILVQLAFGAAYRHFDSNHAIIAHLLWAVVVIILLSWIAMWTLEQYPENPLLTRLGKSLASLIGVQMLLGGLAFFVVVMGAGVGVTLRWLIPAAHVVVGALMLACMTCLTACSFRLRSPRHADVSAAAPQVVPQ